MSIKPFSRPALVKPETLRTRVEDYMRNEITNGHFRPGERLIERELCEFLGVSRPSLREALRKLEAEKLINIIPHRGPVVASISIRDARELYAIRGLLEGFAAHEFARIADESTVAKLGETVKNLRAAAGSGSREQLLTAKSNFYSVLLGGCGNQLVSEILNGLLSRVNLLRATSLTQPDRLPGSLKEIDDLYELIAKHDAVGAQKRAQQHIHNAEKAALDILSDQLANHSKQADVVE